MQCAHACKIHPCKKTDWKYQLLVFSFSFWTGNHHSNNEKQAVAVRHQLSLQYHSVTIWFSFSLLSLYISSSGRRPGELSFNSAEKRTSLWTVTSKLHSPSNYQHMTTSSHQNPDLHKGQKHFKFYVQFGHSWSDPTISWRTLSLTQIHILSV